VILNKPTVEILVGFLF